MMCAGCMLPRERDDIDHDETGGWCAWLACGHAVGWQTDPCRHPDHRGPAVVKPAQSAQQIRSNTVTDYTAKIRSKGLDATGVTEDLARKMYDNLGGHYLAIVELHVDDRHESADGKRKVDLVLSQVEPSTDHALDDHLRELTRALHYNRKLHSEDEDPHLEGFEDIEPKVADVLAHGKAALINTGHDGEPRLFSDNGDDQTDDTDGDGDEDQGGDAA